MSDTDKQTPEAATTNNNGSTTLPSASSLESTLPQVQMPPQLQIPESAIPHMESAILNSAVGAAAGGRFGLVFFRSGKGWRMASVGAGVGVALGSAVERYVAAPDEPPRSIFKVEGLF